jgi:outer membrane protein assembly factor BamB
MSNPQGRSQSILFLALLSAACLLLCGIASAAPSITLSMKSGPPTSRILVSGRGFEPNVGVDIYFGIKHESLVVTNGQGAFDKAEIYVPRSARPGEHWVTALERNNDKGAQKPFLVQTNWSQFHFEAEGTGLNPFENVLSPRTVGNLGLLWSYTTGFAVFSSPVVANGVTYVGSEDGNVYALNANTGVKLWSYNTGAGVDSSPAVANGVVYIGSGFYGSTNVSALNASSGTLLWSYATGGAVWSSPTVANGVVYVGANDNDVYALDASTGALLWRYATGGPVEASPAVADGVAYVGSLDNNVYAVNASTGALLWTYRTGNAISTLPAVANGVVYVNSDDDYVYALNASSGVLLWRYKTGSLLLSSPAVANGVVYVASYDKSVYALNARTGIKLWSYKTVSIVYSSPAVANGVVYVGSEGGSEGSTLYALNASTGALLWSYTTGILYEYSSPAVVNGMVYIGSCDYNIYAFALPGGDKAEKGASERPDLKTLRPDFNLKVSQPGARVSGAEL